VTPGGVGLGGEEDGVAVGKLLDGGLEVSVFTGSLHG
jgi:hypothetical protein